MKAIIIEDEHVAAQTLQRLISGVNPDIEIIAVLQSVEDSIEWFSHHLIPDLVFMDIHLADGSAFSIFDELSISCPIIFTTAYDQYAIKAFEVNSIDYLLKPINKKDLERAITKYMNNTDKVDNSDIISNLLSSLKHEKTIYKTHFLMPVKDKLMPLAIEKIAYFYTENKMVRIVTFDGQTFFLDNSLDELFSQLNPFEFFRANRQYIISHKSIKDISIWFGNKLSINMLVDLPDKIIVSRARVPEFKTWFTR